VLHFDLIAPIYCSWCLRLVECSIISVMLKRGDETRNNVTWFYPLSSCCARNQKEFRFQTCHKLANRSVVSSLLVPKKQTKSIKTTKYNQTLPVCLCCDSPQSHYDTLSHTPTDSGFLPVPEGHTSSDLSSLLSLSDVSLIGIKKPPFLFFSSVEWDSYVLIHQNC